MTLQVSRKPFINSTAADIANFNIDISSQTLGNFARNVSVTNLSDGATLHIRWRAVTRPFFNDNAATTTSFSNTIRVTVKDGLSSALRL